MGELTVTLLPQLQDNYAFLLEVDGETVVIDPAEANSVIEACDNANISAIWNTHHHSDHTAGNGELQALFGCPVVAAKRDAERIPGFTTGVRAGDCLRIGSVEAQVLSTPGHTANHISFHFPEQKLLFVGDTMFSIGCGRLLGGSAEQLHASLETLAQLDEETLIYCGHEYTEQNLYFARVVEADNEQLAAYATEVRRRRQQGEPTVPTTLGREKALNPFLRVSTSKTVRATIRRQCGTEDSEPAKLFAALRQWKDEF